MVLSTFVPGAEIITFLAPAFICPIAFSLEVKIPLHSKTISTFRDFQGRLFGSFSE